MYGIGSERTRGTHPSTANASASGCSNFSTSEHDDRWLDWSFKLASSMTRIKNGKFGSDIRSVRGSATILVYGFSFSHSARSQSSKCWEPRYVLSTFYMRRLSVMVQVSGNTFNINIAIAIY